MRRPRHNACVGCPRGGFETALRARFFHDPRRSVTSQDVLIVFGYERYEARRIERQTMPRRACPTSSDFDEAIALRQCTFVRTGDFSGVARCRAGLRKVPNPSRAGQQIVVARRRDAKTTTGLFRRRNCNRCAIRPIAVETRTRHRRCAPGAARIRRHCVFRRRGAIAAASIGHEERSAGDESQGKQGFRVCKICLKTRFHHVSTTVRGSAGKSNKN